jgi:hypothetical protein
LRKFDVIEVLQILWQLWDDVGDVTFSVGDNLPEVFERWIGERKNERTKNCAEECGLFWGERTLKECAKNIFKLRNRAPDVGLGYVKRIKRELSSWVNDDKSIFNHLEF